MTIKIDLSEASIESAIRQLEEYRDHLDERLEQVVDILVHEGAEIAQRAYGNFGVEAVPYADGMEGSIDVIGDMPLIAEFGAGDATMPVEFANAPRTPVYSGSYSLLEGTAEYYDTGFWHFAGKRFHEVPARHGLLDAKKYIIENSTDVAREVFEG